MPTSLRSTTKSSKLKTKKTVLSPVQLGRQYYDRLMKKKEEKLKSGSKVPTHHRMTAQTFASIINTAAAKKKHRVTKKQEALAHAQAWYLAQCSDKTYVEDISDDESAESLDDYSVALNEVLDSRRFRQSKANGEQALVPYPRRSFPNNEATEQKPVSLIRVPRAVAGSDTTSIQPYNENNLALEEVTISGASSAASHNTRQKRFTVRTDVTYEYTTTFGEGKKGELSDEEITSSTTHPSTTKVDTSSYQKDNKLSPAVNYTRSLNLKETMRLG